MVLGQAFSTSADALAPLTNSKYVTVQIGNRFTSGMNSRETDNEETRSLHSSELVRQHATVEDAGSREGGGGGGGGGWRRVGQ